MTRILPVPALAAALLMSMAALANTAQAPGTDEGTRTTSAAPVVQVVSTASAKGTPTFRQIEGKPDLTELYPLLDRAELALATVPDPRVPRHRRGYDLAIMAIIQGMLDAGYVLDRYDFPWQDVLDTAAGKRDGEASSETGPRLMDDGHYGTMLFRRDRWRQGAAAELEAGGTGTAVRALYLVPETASYGVPTRTFQAAAKRILTQLQPRTTEGSPVVKIVAAPHALCSGSTARPELLALAPVFSGTLDSIAQAAQSLRDDGLGSLCMVSASATAASNFEVDRLQGSAVQLRYRTLATSDELKLARVWDESQKIQFGRARIALLTENSVFGYDLCALPRVDAPTQDCSASGMSAAQKRRCVCEDATHVVFPANIADVRHGRSARRAAKAGYLQQVLPGPGRYLPLADGSGNASEFPDSQQAQLTSVGSEIELSRAVRLLENLHPDLIVVVATDIRDRLFLFDELRRKISSAQLVDLEADVLLTHPDHLHASRGALVLASSRLFWYGLLPSGADDPPSSEGLHSAQTDRQLLLRLAVYGIGRDPGWFPPRPRMRGDPDDLGPVAHVVSSSRLVPLIGPSNRWHRFSMRWAVPLASLAGLLLLVAGAPSVQGLREVSPTRSPRYWIAWPTWLGSALLVGAAVLASVAQGSAATAVLAVLVLTAFLLSTSYQTAAYLRAIPRPGGTAARWPGSRRAAQNHALVLVATPLVGAMVGWWLWMLISDDTRGLVLLERLAFAAGEGLAPAVAMSLAVLTLLYADTALSAARAISERNADVALQAFGKRAGTLGLVQWHRLGLAPTGMFHFIAILLLALTASSAWPLKTTLYGSVISVTALAAVIALCYVSLSFFANAMLIRDRVLTLCAAIRAVASTPGVVSKEGVLGLWPDREAAGFRFAGTPASAHVTDAPVRYVALLQRDQLPTLAARIRRARCEPPDPDPGANAVPAPRMPGFRAALFVYLASELSLVRWASFSTAICCLAVAAFVYLFPVSGANGFILFNLGLLLALGLVSGHTAVMFERDDVLSNVLCNSARKLQFSTALFNYIAFPVVILAIVLAVAQVPGVLDWSGGLVDWLLRLVGGSLWR